MPMDTKHSATKTILNSGRLKAEQTFDFSVSFPELAIFSLQLRDEDAGARAATVHTHQYPPARACTRTNTHAHACSCGLAARPAPASMSKPQAAPLLQRSAWHRFL